MKKNETYVSSMKREIDTGRAFETLDAQEMKKKARAGRNTGVCDDVPVIESAKFSRSRKRFVCCDRRHGPSQLIQVEVDDYDFLGAIKLGKQHLINSNGDHVKVESLRGKVIGLYFAPLDCKLLPSYLRLFYRTLKQTEDDDKFEMIYVAQPPMDILHSLDLYRDAEWYDKYYNLSIFNKFMSTVPWLAVPFDDEDWRYHLSNFFTHLPFCNTSTTIIDTRTDKLKVLRLSADDCIRKYGPQCYPFTIEKQRKLHAQFFELGKKTSIIDILGSDSRNHLINRHGDKVLISTLVDKDVGLYAYKHPISAQLSFINELVEIYEENRGNNFEIVFINIQNYGGYEDEKSFNDALSKMPWLALPFGDDRFWNLQRIMLSRHYITSLSPITKDYEAWGNHPIFFIKPKGEALLEPYGYQVLTTYGREAFPFTRLDAVRVVLTRLKSLTFEVFNKKATELGVNFVDLIRNKGEEVLEDVSLLDINRKERRGILLLFANLDSLSDKRLVSLVKAYSKSNESSSFEVIFVSLDMDCDSFLSHFSDDPPMPWLAVKRQLNFAEHRDLLVSTIGFNIYGYTNHFLAFGEDNKLVRVGITKSFDDSVFPFTNEDEHTKHTVHCLKVYHGWVGEADQASQCCNGWCIDESLLEEARAGLEMTSLLC